MPVLTLTTAGTRQKFDGVAVNPSERFMSRIHIKAISGGTVYIGFQPPKGVSNAVSATVYDISLLPGDEFTFGWGDDGYVDLGATWWDASADGTKISYAPESR